MSARNRFTQRTCISENGSIELKTLSTQDTTEIAPRYQVKAVLVVCYGKQTGKTSDFLVLVNFNVFEPVHIQILIPNQTRKPV